MKKKVLLTLMAFTLIATSCKKYDDDFRDLNARIDALAAQVQGVNALVAGILSTQVTLAQLNAAIATIPNPTAAIATLTANLATLTGTVGSIQTALGILATSFTTQTGITNAALLSLTNAVVLLQGQLIGVNSNLATLLAANNVYTGPFSITNEAELSFAEGLGTRVALINSATTVVITPGTLSETRVNAVTARMVSVLGAFSYTGTNAVTFPALTSVSGTTSILNAVGSIANFPVLASVGNLTITQLGTTAATRLNSLAFPALASAGIITAAGANEIDFAAVTSISLPALRTFTGNLAVSGALLTSFSAPAITALVAGNNLTVSGAELTTVDLGALATSVENLSITGTAISSLSLSSLVSVGTATSLRNLTLQSNALATYNLPVLTTAGGTVLIGGTGGTLTPTIILPVLAFSGALTTNRATTILLPALTSTGVVLTFNQATTVSAPFTRIDLAASPSQLVAAAVTNLTIGTNAAVAFANIPAAVTILRLNGTGGNPDVTLTAAGAAAYTSITLSGALGAVAIGSATAAATTSVSTSGTMVSLVVDNLDLMTTLILGHTHLLTSTAGHSLTVTGNALVTSLTLNQNFVRTLVITNNLRLAMLSLGMAILPFGETLFTFTITGNFTAANPGFGMVGTYTAPGSGILQAFSQAGLFTAKAYITAAYAVTPGTPTNVTLNLNYATSGLPGTTFTAVAEAINTPAELGQLN